MLLPLALLPAALAGPLDCGTPAALRALRGGPADHPGMRTPAPGFAAGAAAPPSEGLANLGEPPPEHLETEHFLIVWGAADPPSEALLTATAEGLEVAHAAFQAQGWRLPVSMEAYRLWVVLDPSLGGTTGYTTEWFPGDGSYPEGVPAIYLNPSSLDFGAAFYASLAAHELMHAVQYAYRDYAWSEDDTSEAWYWEASATHASELADPSVDGHLYISAWYADQPHLRFDAVAGSHHYGMFLLNTWLDEGEAHTMRAVWEESAPRPGEGWEVLLADTVGGTPGALWGDFTGAVGNGQLSQSADFADVALAGLLTDGVEGDLPLLGTHYYEADAAVEVEADGAVVLSGPAGAADVVALAPGDRLAVTATADDTAYALSVRAPGGEEEDPGDPTPDDPDGDDPGGVAPPGSAADDERGGCAHAPAAPALGLALVGLLAVGRRR